MTPIRNRGQQGSIIVPVLVVIVICGGLAGAVITTNFAANQEARSLLANERSFQLAEAGADWTIAEVRRLGGKLPAEPVQTVAAHSTGDFVIRVVRGNTNGIDDDADGTVDNDEEESLVRILSTGRADGARRTLEVVLREAVEVPTFSGSIGLNVDAPLLDLKGNAFILDGREHFISGILDPDRPGIAGITSPAPEQDLIDQIDPKNYDQILGKDLEPSVEQADAIDLNRLVEQAKNTAEYILAPGTHSGLNLGTPTKEGVTVAYCNGDLHLSGGTGGAGLLSVDGDLTISGSFEWVGIVFVRGRVRMVGGGGEKRVIGAMVAGEEVMSSVSTTEVTVTGTVDILYSTDAINLAIQRLSVLSLVSWQEVGNPAE